MDNHRFLTYLKDSKFILALILVVFFLKGVFLSALQPIFVGQDEARHYNTVQYLAEPEKTRIATGEGPKKDLRDSNNFATYRYSEEIKGTATATNTNLLRSDIYDTIIFSDNYNGENESVITSKQWPAINLVTPDIAGSGSLYHKVASYIERVFSGQNILIRFYSIRIFSVLLATLAVFFFYLTTKTIGFSERNSLLLTAILSFHPKFSVYSTNINYDALLVPLFFLFVYAGALTLKKGLNWKTLSLLLISVGSAIFTKPTGYILVVVLACLLAYLLSKKVKIYNQLSRYTTYSLCLIALFAITYYLIRYLSSLSSHTFNQTISTLHDYLSKTFNWGMFLSPSTTYWGILSWVNSWSLTNATNSILVIQAIAVIGLGILFLSKKEYPQFLPAKKYVFFLIGMIIALQLGIRFADWTVFNQTGSIILGLPGRYFLPNLPAHIILTFVGIGAFLSYFKKEKYFETVLAASLILMFSLTLYLIFNVMILRFYF